MNKAIKGLFVGVLMMISSVNASRQIEVFFPEFLYTSSIESVEVPDHATWADFKEALSEMGPSLTPKGLTVHFEYDEDEEPDKEGLFEAVDNERIPQHVGVAVVERIRRQ